MKKTTITIGLLLALVSTVLAQQHNETLKREYQFEKKSSNNVLYLANISGHMDVEGYDGDIIQVEAKIKLLAKTEARLEQAKEAIGIALLDRMDTMAVYSTNPCSTFGRSRSTKRYKDGWGYNWNNQKDCHDNFDYSVDFKVKVPKSLNIVVSTVNDGDVVIVGVDGKVRAQNVNGSITLRKVSRATYANTINGDVTIEFKSNPVLDARYYSLNGDIRTTYLERLSADMSFKSFNGDFYTNIQSLEHLPVEVKQQEIRKGKGITFKVDAKSIMRVGSGGVHLDFETFNGDVFVKEKLEMN